MTAIRSFWWVAIAVLCFASWAIAGTTATLNSEGTFEYDGINVGPYEGKVNGGPNTQIVCDDFVDESVVNKTWKVDITSFSNLASDLGNTLWGSYYLSKNKASTTIVDWYEEAAWLTEGLIKQSANSNNQAYYSCAIWAVFDPTDVLKWLTKHDGNGHGPDNAACKAIFGSNCGSVKLKNPLTSGLLWMAQQDYKTGNYSNLLIITALHPNGKACSVGNCPSQEFFEVVVAEGGAAGMYLLLAAVCCLGGMFLRSRRQGLGRAA